MHSIVIEIFLHTVNCENCFLEPNQGQVMFTWKIAITAEVCISLHVFVGFTGESLASVEQWLISVENRVVCVAQEVEGRTLITGLAALFAVYFVFNLKYQPEAEATLEFIQRYTCSVLSLTATVLCYRFHSHKI